MSLFTTTTLHCSACDTTSDFQAAGSVNADRRPDLREEIMENRFQMVDCPSCGEPMRLEPLFNYLDMELGLWIAAYPPRRIVDYVALEDEVQALFDESYGKAATEAAQQVGADLRPRLTFGWAATREKLFLRRHGIDDVDLEMLKLDLLRRLPDAPLRPGVELRLVAILEDQMAFVWLDTATEEVLEEFEANRALLTAIEDAEDAWAPVRESLTKGMFIDMQKLYIGEGRDAA